MVGGRGKSLTGSRLGRPQSDGAWSVHEFHFRGAIAAKSNASDASPLLSEWKQENQTMKAHQLPLEHDTSEETATGTLPKPDPENRMSIKLDKRSKYVAPDTMRPAGNCSDSSDFDPAVSASSFATGALTRSSWAGLGRHPPSRAFGSRDPIASGRLLSAMRFAVGGQRTGRCSQRTGSHDIGRPGAVGLGLDRDRSRNQCAIEIPGVRRWGPDCPSLHSWIARAPIGPEP